MVCGPKPAGYVCEPTFAKFGSVTGSRTIPSPPGNDPVAIVISVSVAAGGDAPLIGGRTLFVQFIGSNHHWVLSPASHKIPAAAGDAAVTIATIASTELE